MRKTDEADWFIDALDEAAAAAPKPKYGRLIPAPANKPPRPAEAKEAAAIFAKVASGKAPMVGSGPVPPPPWESGLANGAILATTTRLEGAIVKEIMALRRDNISLKQQLKSRFPKPGGELVEGDEIVSAITTQIRNDEDPRAAASRWLTVLTAQITDTIKDIELDNP